ncbi:hypothetical protein BPAE_0455g00010 [Botrytis paeoniae]|uniref:Mitochondrial division protein 1 n=1 Tax=Botrytis paeoniae TaxID=278948 RepID=A0A4Z1F1S0_9HELO|nr:hypothetical protein BPAE_0455g00010 [Botrytis paeoniae]
MSFIRLLQRKPDGEIVFREPTSGEVPPYAILSHTWGPNDEEVTFEDILNGTGEVKPGYEKIRFCGEQARQDGLEYFWIDTCCINKSNNAELSRSINSMFCWYRNAARCYVYLLDVSGCSVGALEGQSLSRFSIEERLQWIQHRQTTLAEDKVYSLLGIFDVYILPIYGEGFVRAYDRLLDKFYKVQKCIQDLRLSDPRDDKKRIEEMKGGILQDSYKWILENSDFRQWRNDQQSRLLWIKGNPGKGKTMLLCGVINELEKSGAKSVLLSYFFCQATDSRINYATAVLRGLIYLLVDQQPSLISHIQTKYDQAGKMLFEDTNAWVALCEIFTNILHDSSLDHVYLIVDALDECIADLPRLMDLIVQTSSISSRIKWIVSNRNWQNIEKALDVATQNLRLCLELNEKSVSAAVTVFIQFKVEWLATRNKYSNDTREMIRQQLMLNANGTFLWVALICQELSNISGWRAREKLKAFPSGLDALYRRMLDQIIYSEYAELCISILAVVSAVYRPITLDELTTFVDMPNGVADDYEALSEIIGLCGSFLTIRECTVFFVHQSAKDFLIEKASKDIFPFTMENIHSKIFSRSLQAMSLVLRRDVYNLRAPGISIDQVKQPNPDPLAAVRYSCLYWVDHLLDSNIGGDSNNDLKDNDSIYKFLSQSFLYWFEALSLIRSLPNGIVMIRKLEDWVQANESPNLYAFIHDAKRFALYSRSVIEQTPLQSYCSALVFAPEKSIVRTTFEKCIPPWIQKKPIVEPYWNAMLQTLEGHKNSVFSVAFSPDGKQVVSGSRDNTIRLWNTATGQQIQPTLNGHTSSVNSVAFSPDVAFSPNGKQVVSGSRDNTIRLWNTETELQIQLTLNGHTSSINSVAFSPDSKQIVSGSNDNTIRLWDTVTGQQIQPTLNGHTSSVNSVAFSPNGKQVVSGSRDKTVRLWNTATGQQIQPTLEGYTSWVNSVAFSPNGKQVVSGYDDKTIQLWDTATGQQIHPTLNGHTSPIKSVAFSPDGKQIIQPTLNGHTSPIKSVAFSPDGKQVVSRSYDNTVQLWDTTTGLQIQPTLKGHTDWVLSVAFSPDIKQIPTLNGHTSSINSIAFSPDGKQVISGSNNNTIRLWDTVTGQQIQPAFNGHTSSVNSVAFSPDGKQVISESYNNTVQLWDTTTGLQIQLTLNDNISPVSSIAFSPDDKQIVSGSRDKTIRLWDIVTGLQIQPALNDHINWINSVAFSPNSKEDISGSRDNTIRLWGTAIGQQIQPTLEGHICPVNSIAFSPGGKQVVSESDNQMLLYTLAVSNDWIIEDGANILWLPPDYRTTVIAIYRGSVVLAQSSGRISFFEFTYCWNHIG